MRSLIYGGIIFIFLFSCPVKVWSPSRFTFKFSDIIRILDLKTQ